ncbi:Adenylate kinase isoenzyme 5 [Anabarilius grahami]|uniref:Adenylate kinase isoenzyme 5 n=1 Tax=Anabarilius grahami TaxID=495550 RepID=A0A3N0Y1D7_ANAGA|nr:Adenylate kinase isoenzyme 5 [Anabarilius grahami]
MPDTSAFLFIQLDADRDEEEVFCDISMTVDNKLYPTKEPVADGHTFNDQLKHSKTMLNIQRLFPAPEADLYTFTWNLNTDCNRRLNSTGSDWTHLSAISHYRLKAAHTLSGFIMSDSPQVTHNLQLLLLSPDKNIACGACGVWKVTGARSHASLTRNVMAVIDKPEGQSTHISHKERNGSD